MKITSMRNVDWGNKVKAILTIKTSEGFELKNFKLIEGINGFFVASPSLKGKDEQYHDTIWIPKERRDSLNDMASGVYDSTIPANESYPQFKRAVAESEVPF